MPAEIIDGNKIAENIMGSLSREFKEAQDASGKVASLRLLKVGDDPGARIYAEAKIKRGTKLGVSVELERLERDVTRESLLSRIESLSSNPDVTGIMIENPLPAHLSFTDISDHIPMEKDVDGTSSANQGRIVNRTEFLTPATANAVVHIMEQYPELRSSIVTIVNRTPVVGRPLSQMLLNRDYTVTVCHSKTPDVVIYTRRSDVVIAAVGKPNFFNDEMINPDCTFIDVGINYVEGKVVGDGDFASLSGWVKRITPVPGGVGPITASLIFSNLLKAFKFQNSL